MLQLKTYIVDAFTDKLFQGNPAGVVVLDEYLDKDIMQKIAKEINLSETAFLLREDSQKYDYNIYYFTPSAEVDFCGHATIASSFIIGSEIKSYQKIKLNTNIGIVTVDLQYIDHTIDSIMIIQPEAKFKPFKDRHNEIFSILGIDSTEYEPSIPIFYGYTGNWDLFIPVKSALAIEKAKPNLNLLKEHNLKHNITSVHLFTFDSSPYFLYARNFGPAVGIDEDYVTGSSNGALCAYLQQEKRINKQEFTILQGNKNIRLGEIKVKITDGTIQLGGKAIKVTEGYIKI